jgi:hypothetical protein
MTTSLGIKAASGFIRNLNGPPCCRMGCPPFEDWPGREKGPIFLFNRRSERLVRDLLNPVDDS